MAWSDAARAAALEARRQHHAQLHATIGSGIHGANKALTISALRRVAAKAMKNNRNVFASAGIAAAKRNEMIYKTGALTVHLKKQDMARALSSYGGKKGYTASKFKLHR